MAEVSATLDMAEPEVVGNFGAITIDRKSVIASGRTCKVYVGLFDKKKVAVKRIQHDDMKFEREAKVLRDLRNDYIVHYLFFDKDHDFEFIVMEKCRCSLEKYLDGSESVGKPDALKILKDMSLGVRYLHSQNMIHRNLHTSNILLAEDSGVITAKIADFGLTRHSPDGSSVETSGKTGSRRFNNPEELNGENPGKKSDIYALGHCFYATVSGNKRLFGGKDLDVYEAIRKGTNPDLSPIFHLHNGYAHPLIKHMLKYSKVDRPDISEVLSHFLFWNADNTILFLQRASDFLEDNRKNRNEGLNKAMHDASHAAIGSEKWKDTLYKKLDRSAIPIFEQHFQTFRIFNHEAEGLLRAIRNWSHHFDKPTPPELKSVLGGTQQNMIRNMTETFPGLVPTTYEVFRSRSSTSNFKSFYEYNEN